MAPKLQPRKYASKNFQSRQQKAEMADAQDMTETIA